MKRFWDKVDKSSGEDACWPWLASRWGAHREYGQFKMDRRPKQAHRMAWQFTNGSIPDGMMVCHRCDNPICCNPAHLFIGSARDNKHDCMNKKRHMCGERHHSAKLTVDDVRRLRELNRYGASYIALGGLFGISRAHAENIAKGKKWKSVETSSSAG